MIFIHSSKQYSNALIQTNTIDQDTIHLLFPNLNKLLNFQRKFLIKLESIAECSWMERHWGAPFADFVSKAALFRKQDNSSFRVFFVLPPLHRPRL